MNTQTSEGNTEIPEVEDVVIEDGDDTETIKSKYADYKTKVDERNGQLFARTKKAEGFELKDGKWVKPAKSTETTTTVETTTAKKELTVMDGVTLAKANIPEEDIPDVVEYAQFKGISLAEALKSPIVQTTLAQKAEARKVADGTATGDTRRGSAKVSDELLLSNASKGIMPEKDEDMARLVALRRGK